MQLTVTGRHIDVTDAIKVYGKDKLQHVVDKHFPQRSIKAHMIMSVEKYRHLAEIEMHGLHKPIYSKVSSTDMYTSLDKVIDKIERQLIKYKARYDKHGKNRRSIRIPVENEYIEDTEDIYE